MSFEATCQNVKILQNITKSIKELVNHGTFNITEKGITLSELDYSHVALINLTIRKKFFETYVCKSSLKISVSINEFTKIIKFGRSNALLKLKVDENSDFLQISFDEGEKTSNYKLRLINKDEEEFVPPEIEFDAKIKMDSKELKKICLALVDIDHSIKITSDKKRAKFQIYGKRNHGLYEIRGGNEKNKIKASKEVSGVFPLKYLNYFCKGACLNNVVIIKIAEKKPLLMKYKFDHGNIKYMIAPKIDI